MKSNLWELVPDRLNRNASSVQVNAKIRSNGCFFYSTPHDYSFDWFSGVELELK